jgi:hypothetical protein
MQTRFEEEVAETRNFNTTLIATMNEFASDVCTVNSSANFCKVFNSEYRSMMGADDAEGAPDAAGASRLASPFDSDFTSSSDSEAE